MRSATYSILAPILAGLAGLAGLLGLLATPAPAAAQSCTYDLSWSFDSDLGEWGDDSTPMIYDGTTGHDAAGSMLLQKGSGVAGNFVTGLYEDEILTALGVSDPDAYVTAGGLSVSGYGYASSNAGDYWRFTIYEGPGASYITSTSTTQIGQWEQIQVTAGAGETGAVSLIRIDYRKEDSNATVSAWFDDVVVSIPCDNVVTSSDPTPTATPITPTTTPRPTATPIAGITTTLPTPAPVITYADDPGVGGDPGAGGGDGFTLPGPLPIPDPPENTINIDPMWDLDVVYDFVAIVRTVPVLLQQYKLITVVVAIGAAVLAIRWLSSFTQRRSEEV